MLRQGTIQAIASFPAGSAPANFFSAALILLARLTGAAVLGSSGALIWPARAQSAGRATDQ
jgi:hypothetical protein